MISSTVPVFPSGAGHLPEHTVCRRSHPRSRYLKRVAFNHRAVVASSQLPLCCALGRRYVYTCRHTMCGPPSLLNLPPPTSRATAMATVQTCSVTFVSCTAGVIHRDIKPENVCIISDLASLEIRDVKLIDFGLSNTVTAENPHLMTKCGSTGYSAPELLIEEQTCGRSFALPILEWGFDCCGCVLPLRWRRLCCFSSEPFAATKHSAASAAVPASQTRGRHGYFPHGNHP